MKNKFLALSLISLLTFSGLVGCGNNGPTDTQKPGDSLTPPTDEPFSGTLAKGPTLLDGEKGIAIRYTRQDNKYDDRGLWIWENNGGEGVEYRFDTTDDFGAACFKPLSTWSKDVIDNGLGIITKKIGSWDGQSDDMIFDFASYTPDSDGYYNVFIKEGESTLFDNPDMKYADDFINVEFNNVNSLFFKTTNLISSYKIYKDEELLFEESGLNVKYINFNMKDYPLDIASDYYVEVTFKETNVTMKSKASKRRLYNSEIFNNAYYFDGELGAIYTNQKTTFRVWSPFSSSLKLRIYDNGTPKAIDASKGDDNYQEYEMNKGEKGTFEYVLTGDLAGKYYTYVVSNNTYKNKEIVDPYAKSTGINGLRGMIVDFSKTNPNGWNEVKPHQYKRTEQVIYETHVADVTSSDTWGGSKENQKKFLGLIEEGTTYTKDGISVSTGFDHIKDLGVNAVQLIPIFDQANDELATDDKAFNWGYNPLNYNSLEGIYSSDPFDGYSKIKEFKEVVKAYNEAGINIIMDVVYNHVNGALGSNFDVLMPEYYFRYSNEKLSNGSGCGNEFASENKMARKFMIDSTEFLAEEYKLGGFRFDLMALHDLDTMNLLVENLKTKVNPAIFVHGEPWTGGTSTLVANFQASQANIKQFKGYGAFNDKMRDGLIRGGLAASTDKGWITDESSSGIEHYVDIEAGIKGRTGSSSKDPLKATNYVTCHDNYTLYDRIKAAKVEGDDKKISQMATLANALVLTSEGTSFILAGEEMLRTKGGDSNSYDSGYKVNEIDYSRKITFKEVYDNYKKLINFKISTPLLHLETVDAIDKAIKFSEDTNSESTFDYELKDENATYRIIHSNFAAKELKLDLSKYDILIDTLNSTYTNKTEFVVLKGQTLVLKEK